MKKKIKVMLLGLVMALGMSTSLFAAPAAAHNQSHSTCISNWKKSGWTSDTFYAKNNCGHTVYMKFKVTFGSDGSCRAVSSGRTIGWNTGFFGSARVKAVPC